MGVFTRIKLDDKCRGLNAGECPLSFHFYISSSVPDAASYLHYSTLTTDCEESQFWQVIPGSERLGNFLEWHGWSVECWDLNPGLCLPSPRVHALSVLSPVPFFHIFCPISDGSSLYFPMEYHILTSIIQGIISVTSFVQLCLNLEVENYMTQLQVSKIFFS